jgi:hypothetical protein
MVFLARALNALEAFGQEAGKHINGAAVGTWKQMDAFGQATGASAGLAAARTWKHLDTFGQEAGKNIGNAAVNTKDWVVTHPGQTAGMVGCVVAAPLAIAAAPLALGAAGFSAGGIAAGKYPASWYASRRVANKQPVQGPRPQLLKHPSGILLLEVSLLSFKAPGPEGRVLLL